MPKMKLPINYNEANWQTRKAAREQYIKEQNGNCYHCGKPLIGLPAEEIQDIKIREWLFPKNFFKWPIHLHHNHDTGITIGAVHAKCNAYLWEYKGE